MYWKVARSVPLTNQLAHDYHTSYILYFQLLSIRRPIKVTQTEFCSAQRRPVLKPTYFSNLHKWPFLYCRQIIRPDELRAPDLFSVP